MSLQYRYIILLFSYCLIYLNGFGASDTIRLQLKWWHQFQNAGYYAAQIKGFYKAEGLHVKLIEGDAQHAPVAEVLSKRAHFGISGSDVLTAYANGSEVMAIGALFQHSPYVIIAPRKNNIKFPSDLIGKKIMASNDQGWVELKAVFLKEGIPLDSLQLLNHSWKNDDLLTGAADAMTGYESVEVNQLKKMGVDPITIKPINYGIDFYGDVLFSLRSTVAENPKQTAAFRRAGFKGWEYAMDHPGEIADYILTLPGVIERGVTKQDLLNEAAAMRKLMLPDLIEIGHMNKGRWQHILDIHQQLHLIDSTKQLNDFLYDESETAISEWYETVAYIIGSILILLLLVGAYSVVLRKMVHSKTKELHNEIEQKTTAQLKLQESEERLELATTAAGLGIWDWNIVTGEVYFNDLWKTMLGYLPHELENSFATFESLLHPEDRPLLFDQLNKHIDNKLNSYQVAIRLQTKNKDWKWILTVSRALQRDNEGKAMRLTGIHFDVDDIKKKEIELQSLTNELMNTNRELQQFAYITSHNLRAPVANLLSLVSLVNREEMTEKNKLLCDKIDFSVHKLDATLNDLNQILSARFYRADRVELVNFEDRFLQIIQLLNQEIAKSKAIIHCSFTEAPQVMNTTKTIDSVMINLLTNAIKYGKPNENPEIHLTTTHHQDGYIVLTITDNGIGIDLNKHKYKLFGLYQRFHHNIEGKGLGLYIIKTQIEAQGGKIEIDSKPYGGTTLRVFFKTKPI